MNRSKRGHASGCNSTSFGGFGFAMIDVVLTGKEKLPDFAEQIVRTFGIATINWGRMEQLLELLLLTVHVPEYNTGENTPVPTTSFRLKVERFERLYAKHPSFAPVHHIATPVCLGLKKANKSRVRFTHCSVQNFNAGPPSTVTVQTVKGRAGQIHTSTGTWTAQDIENFSDLLAVLWHDLRKIAEIAATPTFRQSLRKELSRTQRALIWGRHLRSRLRRLCSRICGAQD
jgi:hypothetical protein